MRLLLGSLLLVCLLAVAGCGGSGGDDGDEASDFITAAVEIYGLSPDDLEVQTTSEARFPLTERTLRTAKVYDRSTEQVYAVALDEDGAIVDEEELAAAELAAQKEKCGALDTRLCERVATLGDDDVLAVTIFTYDQPSIAEGQAPVLAWLDEHGREPDGVGELSPIVDVTLSKNEILKLAGEPAVFRVFLQETGADG